MFKKPFLSRSTSDQVADFLCDAIMSGELSGQMPGVHALAKELGIHHTTAADALAKLQKEGYLKGAGPGKRREIQMPKTARGKGLRVGILLYEPEDIGTEFINELRHQLIQAGHGPVVAKKSMVEMQFDLKRIKKQVAVTKADVWLVLAGSREVLAWFAEQEAPTFAIFGNARELNIAHASPVKVPLMREIIQRLVKLKHKRIVFLFAEQLRQGKPIRLVQAGLDEMEALGLTASSYNLPDWSHEKGSLQACLNSSFQVTPPTALIVDDPILMPAILQFVNERKLSVPGDVSLICLDGDPSFKWMQPDLTRVESDARISIRHAVSWVNRAAKGETGRRNYLTKAKLIEGGTVGPARD